MSGGAGIGPMRCTRTTSADGTSSARRCDRPGRICTSWQREIASWSGARGGSAARALILGVTPELAALDWPKQSRVYAVRPIDLEIMP